MNNPKILIVEDSITAVSLIRGILTSNNYEITDTAVSGEDAVKIAEKKAPDLIIMDIKLKGEIDGIDAAKKINSAQNIPVVFITGDRDKLNRVRIKEASSYGCYLVKPFRANDLIYAIETSLHKHDIMLQLKEKEEWLNALLSSLVTIMIGVSEHDIVTHWNLISETAFGIPASGILGTPFMECGIEWDWMRIYEGIYGSISEEKPYMLDDLHFKNPAKEDRFLNIWINSIKSKDGKLKGFLLNGEDITKRKQLEMQLIQAQKLESVGQLSSGIAHEINTPTQYITDNVYFLKDAFANIIMILNRNLELIKSYKEGKSTNSILHDIEDLIIKNDLHYIEEEVPKSLDQSIQGLSQVAKIVKSMKQFSHPESGIKNQIDINRCIEDVLTISRNEWKYASEAIVNFGKNLPAVPCFPGRFNQVLLNIILNSADAIKEKLGPNPGEKGSIEISTGIENGWAVIKIKDSGIGMADDIKAKIFDPFFTTKGVGKGTGQGLAIAYDIIVNIHKGTINYVSQPGIGTTCEIRLPLAYNEP